MREKVSCGYVVTLLSPHYSLSEQGTDIDPLHQVLHMSNFLKRNSGKGEPVNNNKPPVQFGFFANFGKKNSKSENVIKTEDMVS
jgi:hypothetical protein